MINQEASRIKTDEGFSRHMTGYSLKITHENQYLTSCEYYGYTSEDYSI